MKLKMESATTKRICLLPPSLVMLAATVVLVIATVAGLITLALSVISIDPSGTWQFVYYYHLKNNQ
jgi:hypothetical protein